MGRRHANAETEARLSGLSAEVDRWKEKYEQIQARCDQVCGENEELKTRFDQVVGHNEQMQSRMESLEAFVRSALSAGSLGIP
jgi:predicted nuclease with TOPRIM domain